MKPKWKVHGLKACVKSWGKGHLHLLVQHTKIFVEKSKTWGLDAPLRLWQHCLLQAFAYANLYRMTPPCHNRQPSKFI